MKLLPRDFFYTLSLICMLILVSGCNSSYIEDVKRGSDYAYQPGHPELRTEIAGVISSDQQLKLLISGSIPKNSLIFKKDEDNLRANVSIEIEIKNKNQNKGESFIYPVKLDRSLASSGFEDDIYLFNKEYNVSPGNYSVIVSATDKATGKTTLRSDEVNLPDLEEEVTNITNIRIFAKAEELNDNFFPVTTYDVSLAADSLKFEFQFFNSTPDPVTLQARLIKFRSDSSYSSPMSFVNRSSSSIKYKGIDYRNFEVIQSTQRQLNQPGNVTIEFAFENLPRGNYRFEVSPNLNDKETLYKARDFSIKSNNYPSVKSAEELAAPLIYLMSDKEYEELMSIDNSDTLKAAIDRFWLSNIQNAALTRNIISLYYQRVEEANKLFSNFKEGWKTDMGMVYILLGPPLYQNRSLNEIQWSYNYNASLPEYTFFFKRSKSKSDFYPFDHYILQRDNTYFQIEYRVKELWLSGNILNSSI